MNKHEAMYEYIKQYPPLGQILYFNTIQDMAEMTSLDPVYSDETVLEYTTGDAEREYIFAIKMMKDYDTGTSSLNIDAMAQVNGFMAWIDEQNERKNFPKFPANCFVSRIVNLQNMPSLAGKDDQNRFAEYMFQCKVEYTEERSL